MGVSAKICGLNTLESVAAAVSGDAGFIGFVFFPPSPRYVAPDKAAALSRAVPPTVTTVGLFVDASDDVIAETLRTVNLDMLQLHGNESPDRVRELGGRFGLETMKAIKVESAADVEAASEYDESADWLLFDAKAPRDMEGALPGGNAVTFDWRLLRGWSRKRPWMLSGGLDADNVSEAASISGAVVVDVSSGVEDRPGSKNPRLIERFLDTVGAL